jgi:hypothetical protein
MHYTNSRSASSESVSDMEDDGRTVLLGWLLLALVILNSTLTWYKRYENPDYSSRRVSILRALCFYVVPILLVVVGLTAKDAHFQCACARANAGYGGAQGVYGGTRYSSRGAAQPSFIVTIRSFHGENGPGKI